MRGIAIVGLACRFPGAPTHSTFWENIIEGRDTIARRPSPVPRSENSVFARGVLQGFDTFDRNLFNVSSADALLLDPQHRVLLECSYECFETAGIALSAAPRRTSVFASKGVNRYHAILGQADPSPSAVWKREVFNIPDSLATYLAHSLNLRGESMSVQTACSSSAVAVEMACRSLRFGYSDLALVGAVSIDTSRPNSYEHQDGMIHSKSGYCRPFDDSADGTIESDGCGAVLLKRLDDAISDGDQIYATIIGTGINNDGANKASFFGPSVEGQVEAVLIALQDAGVSADDVGLVEAHGTGTLIGDPIEVAALARAFRHYTNRHEYCALGSVKANIGHCTQASGMASLIKMALALKTATLPGLANLQLPNKLIDFAKSPFYLNCETRSWSKQDGPRLAGLSNFGVGGTNVHLILQEPPSRERLRVRAKERLPLILSGRSELELIEKIRRLSTFVATRSGASLEDVAHTLAFGREHHAVRFIVMAASMAELHAELNTASTDGESIRRHARSNEAFPEWLEGGPPNAIHDAVRGLGHSIELPGHVFNLDRYWPEEPQPGDEDPSSGKRSIYRFRKDYVPFEPPTGVACDLDGDEVIFATAELDADTNVTELLRDIDRSWNAPLLHLGLSIPTEATEALHNRRVCVLYLNQNASSRSLLAVSASQLLSTAADTANRVREYVISLNNRSELSAIVVIAPHLEHQSDSSAEEAIASSLPALLKAYALEKGLGFGVVEVHRDSAVTVNDVGLAASLAKSRKIVSLLLQPSGWQVPKFLPVSVSNNTSAEQEGYVVLGGSGRVGRDLCKHLLQATSVPVVIAARFHDLDLAPGRLYRCSEMSSKWCEDFFCGTPPENAKEYLFVASVDATSPQALENFLGRTVKSVCSSYALIYCIGETNKSIVQVHEVERDALLHVLDSKLRGIVGVVQMLPSIQIKRCIVISSVSSELSGIGFGPYAYLNRLVEIVCSVHGGRAGVSIEVLALDAWLTGLRIGQGMSNNAIPPNLGCETVLQGSGKSPEPIYVSMDNIEIKIGRIMARDAGLGPGPLSVEKLLQPINDVKACAIDFISRVTGSQGASLGLNFIELGLDSMDILDLLDQCNAIANRKLSLREAYAAATLGAFVGCYATLPAAEVATQLSY